MLDRMARDADYRRLADVTLNGNTAEAREMRRKILRRQEDEAKVGDKRQLDNPEAAAPPYKRTRLSPPDVPSYDWSTWRWMRQYGD